MKYNNLILEYAKGKEICVVTLNRPQVLNAMNKNLLLELIDFLEEIRIGEEVKLLIITGEGKAFMSGGDIKEMSRMNLMEFREFILLIQKVTKLIREIEKPVIAAVNGYALGGGCEIAVACDMRVASEDAKFGLPEPSVGLTNTSGITQILPRLIGLGKAMEMVLTGCILDANEADKIGLVNKVVRPEKLREATIEMGEKILSNSFTAIKLARNCIYLGAEVDLNTNLAYETETAVTAFSTEDCKKRLSAFIEKREQKYKTR